MVTQIVIAIQLAPRLRQQSSGVIDISRTNRTKIVISRPQQVAEDRRGCEIIVARRMMFRNSDHAVQKFSDCRDPFARWSVGRRQGNWSIGEELINSFPQRYAAITLSY